MRLLLSYTLALSVLPALVLSKPSFPRNATDMGTTHGGNTDLATDMGTTHGGNTDLATDMGTTTYLPTTKSSCNLRADAKNETKFYMIHEDGREIAMDCALGSAFVQADCDCSKHIPACVTPGQCDMGTTHGGNTDLATDMGTTHGGNTDLATDMGTTTYLPTTKSSCNLRADAKTETKFYMIHEDGREIAMDCALGSAFVQADCDCSKHIPACVTPGQCGCKPELYLPFDEDTNDHSGKNVYVGKEGAPVIKTNVTGATGKGAAYFNGDSKLNIWRFASDDFQKRILIRFNYKEANATSEARNETLVSNDKCENKGSVTVAFDRQNQETVAHLKTTRNNHITVKNSLAWKKVEMLYDDGEFTMAVNDVWTTARSEGNIAITNNPISIGRDCAGVDGFNGYIDELYVYKCF